MGRVGFREGGKGLTLFSCWDVCGEREGEGEGESVARGRPEDPDPHVVMNTPRPRGVEGVVDMPGDVGVRGNAVTPRPKGVAGVRGGRGICRTGAAPVDGLRGVSGCGSLSALNASDAVVVRGVCGLLCITRLSVSWTMGSRVTARSRFLVGSSSATRFPWIHFTMPRRTAQAATKATGPRTAAAGESEGSESLPSVGAGDERGVGAVGTVTLRVEGGRWHVPSVHPGRWRGHREGTQYSPAVVLHMKLLVQRLAEAFSREMQLHRCVLHMHPVPQSMFPKHSTHVPSAQKNPMLQSLWSRQAAAPQSTPTRTAAMALMHHPRTPPSNEVQRL
eukprot:Sspe_Gene.23286::Locus_9028_Transcript_1_1_Confidence_1.000_Length_1245::g.23286::m.23286